MNNFFRFFNKKNKGKKLPDSKSASQLNMVSGSDYLLSNDKFGVIKPYSLLNDGDADKKLLSNDKPGVVKLNKMLNNKSTKLLAVRLSLFVLAILSVLLLFIIINVTALQGTSESYSAWNKFDFGATGNGSSTSFTQRFIGGEQPVSQYTSSDYGGRFGILDESYNCAINITFPANNSDIARGGNAVSNEDDLGLVADNLQITSRVYVNNTQTGLSNINTSFYFGGTYVNSNLTNSSGIAVISYDKSAKTPGSYKILTNYSDVICNQITNNSQINSTIVVFNIPNYAGGKGVATRYVWNQTAILLFNITKQNGTATVFYSAVNVTANATDAAGKHYPESAYVTGYRLKELSPGQYETRVVINRSLLPGYNSVIRWEIYVSDDNYTTHIASARHSDVDVIDPPLCGNTLLETGETCDDGNLVSGDGCSSSCTTEGGGGGGGGGGETCQNTCSSGASEIVCVTQHTLKTQTCGSYDEDSCTEWGGASYTECQEGYVCQNAECVLADCDTSWQCGDWGECSYGSLGDYYEEGSVSASGITGSVIAQNVLTGMLIKEENQLDLEYSQKSQKFASITGSAIKDAFSRIFRFFVNDACENPGEIVCEPEGSRSYKECVEQKSKKETYLGWESSKCAKGEICENGSCIVEHCSDGIQSGDEQGIDCGGSCAQECVKLPSCGDGILDKDEFCDDGNLDVGDGCDDVCKVEVIPKIICSNGIIETGESCDDKNAADGDGCSSNCIVEPGYVCEGEPSVCVIQIKKVNETLINVTIEIRELPLEEEQVVAKVGESVSIIINQGDKVSVTYEDRKGKFVMLKVTNFPFLSSTEVQETHKLKVDEVVANKKIIVTVTSEPITKEILLGGTEIFEFGFAVAAGVDLIQKRTCANTLCDLPPKTEARLCTMSECEEDWKCSWTVCVEGDKISYPYDCFDRNTCETEKDKPGSLPCGKQPVEYPECSGLWDCTNWGECGADYSIDEILQGKVEFEGHKSRVCVDKLAECSWNITEFSKCDLGVPIDVKKVKWCEEEYVEIYERATNKLVSRVKQTQVEKFEELNRVDISLTPTEFTGYCDYCFNGIKDYDETGVDCGGPSCPACVARVTFFDWLLWLVITLWLLLLLLLLLILYKRRKEKEKLEKKKFTERFKEFVKKAFMPGTAEEKIREWKVKEWLKKLLSAPFRLLALPFKIKLVKIKLREHVAERVKIERVVKRVPIIKRIRVKVIEADKRLEALKKKLREWENMGYAGTARLRAHIRELEAKPKKVKYITKVVRGYKIKEFERRVGGEVQREVKKAQSWFAIFSEFNRRRKAEKARKEIERRGEEARIKAEITRGEHRKEAEKRAVALTQAREQHKREVEKTERVLKRTREKEARTSRIKERLRKIKQNFIIMFEEHKKRRAEGKEKRRIKREQKRQIRLQNKAVKFAMIEQKKAERLKEKEKKGEAKDFRKRIKREKKRIKKEKKAKRKERKRKIRRVKAEIRRRKAIELMKKLKLWRKEGYYGTAHLEEELKRLKEFKE